MTTTKTQWIHYMDDAQDVCPATEGVEFTGPEGTYGFCVEHDRRVKLVEVEDTTSVDHWATYGLDEDTIRFQINEEGGQDLTLGQRAELVERFYRENDPRRHRSALGEALDAFHDAFHSEVHRLVEELRG